MKTLIDFVQKTKRQLSENDDLHKIFATLPALPKYTRCIRQEMIANDDDKHSMIKAVMNTTHDVTPPNNQSQLSPQLTSDSGSDGSTTIFHNHYLVKP